MSPSQNLACVTRYRRFESGFLQRGVCKLSVPSRGLGLTCTRRCSKIPLRLIHPPPAPFGDGERINFAPPLAIGERVGKAGPDLFRFADDEVLSCAISAMRKPWRVPCAMR
jgi:hypothetical protein